jgi:hypothetical protein
MGERAVAEELSTLLVKGYWLFHDLPFEKFNIDHAVVGPKGFFVIETKTRRKPKHENAAAEYVPAQAIVAVPGWFTATDTKFPAVWVLNPRGIKAFIEKCQTTLSPEQTQRIAFQLEHHRRLKKE